MNDSSSCHSGKTRSMSRSLRTRSRVSSRSSGITEAITTAALRKAELRVKADGLKKRLAIEQRELELKQEKELLAVETEIKLEDLRLDILKERGDDSQQESSDSDTGRRCALSAIPPSIPSENVAKWLDKSNELSSASSDSFLPLKPLPKRTLSSVPPSVPAATSASTMTL